MKFRVQNESELADKIWLSIKDKLDDGFVCGLRGDLGAGKTTLVKGLARKMGIKDEVTSPTFVIFKNYGRLQHLDLYRFEKPSSADLAEIKDWISQPKTISFIEWPERLPDLNAIFDLEIFINNLGGTERDVELKWN